MFLIVGSVATWEQTVLAACLAVGRPAWVSHQTAARLWDLDARRSLGIHVVTSPAHRVRLDGVVHHRAQLLTPADLATRCRVPTTSAARTLVDCSGRLGGTWTSKSIDELLRSGSTRLGDVRACVARLAGPGRRRLSVIHASLADRLPGYDPGDSDLEVRFLRAVAAAGLPAPVQQHRVRLAGRRCYIDLAYPDVRLAIEVDGWDAHKGRHAFSDDRARANELVAEGWSIVRFTADMSDATIVDIVRRTRGRLAA